MTNQITENCASTELNRSRHKRVLELVNASALLGAMLVLDGFATHAIWMKHMNAWASAIALVATICFLGNLVHSVKDFSSYNEEAKNKRNNKEV